LTRKQYSKKEVKKRAIPQPYLRIVKPKTKNQYNYLEALTNRQIPIVVGSGPAGTGKTQLAVFAAAKAIYDGVIGKIILTRPVVEAGGEKLGFLPGTLEEKIDPYMRPLFDSFAKCFDKNTFSNLIDRNIIEICPLAYIRGRTFIDSYVILDEAQNATVDQIKMVLTRLGTGSQIALTGDPSQSDLPTELKGGLLVWAEKVFEGEDYAAVCNLYDEDCQRRPEVVALLKKYYGNVVK